MAFAVELFEHEGQRRAGRQRRRLIQLEHRPVRLSLRGMDAPGRLLVPVESVLDGPARLIEVRGGTYQGQLARLRGARLKQQDLKLAQMQIAVVLPARTI